MLVLVPAFMMWLAKSCEKMTRNARKRDIELNAQKDNVSVKHLNQGASQVNLAYPGAKVSMQGFMAK